LRAYNNGALQRQEKGSCLASVGLRIVMGATGAKMFDLLAQTKWRRLSTEVPELGDELHKSDYVTKFFPVCVVNVIDVRTQFCICRGTTLRKCSAQLPL